MQRRYEFALGGVLVAAALSAGLAVGLSGPSDAAAPPAGPSPSASSAVSTPAATSSAGAGTATASTVSASGSAGTTTTLSSPRCHIADLNANVTVVADSTSAQ